MPDHSNGRRVRKVRQACDRCKSKKLRCSGTRPCDLCTARRQQCLYSSEDGRSKALNRRLLGRDLISSGTSDMALQSPRNDENSPEIDVEDASSPGTAVFEGQFSDGTSGISFLRRAQARFTQTQQHMKTADDSSFTINVPLMAAGDKPLLGGDECPPLPPHGEAVQLLDLYFDVCVATYRLLHRPSVDGYLSAVKANEQNGLPLSAGLSSSKTAILLGLFAIATFHTQKAKGFSDDEASLGMSDGFFHAAVNYTNNETGLPKVESVQARLIQVFYLLMTCRMNRAWYVFGDILQLISALGIHRTGRRPTGSSKSGADYITSQCRRRVFWTAYILDKYLGVVLGRPPHFHDDDISLEFPDQVNDEHMSSAGPNVNPNVQSSDCQVDAFVHNAKLARIVGTISRSLYPMHPITDEERLGRLRQINRRLDHWKSQLPAFLGSVRPSTLIRSFRRQSIALKVAYCHAIMHANRTSLLTISSPQENTVTRIDEENVKRCIGAAEEVLKIVDRMASEGPLFHAFWWTHYAAFCALSVVLVWKLQSGKFGHRIALQNGHSVFELAERCQSHLANATATNSPSRRYTIILDELKEEMDRLSSSRNQSLSGPHFDNQRSLEPLSQEDNDSLQYQATGTNPSLQEDIIPAFDSTVAQDWLQGWSAMDWMDLDALVCAYFLHFGIAPTNTKAVIGIRTMCRTQSSSLRLAEYK